MNSGDSFHFIESLKLIVVSHHSNVEQQNVESILNEFDTNPYFSSADKVLIDMRKAEIKVDSEVIKKTSTLVYNKLSGKGIQNLAILIDTPQINKVVEYVKAYQQSSKYQVFANLEGALHWLKIPADRKEQIEVKLNYLEKH